MQDLFNMIAVNVGMTPALFITILPICIVFPGALIYLFHDGPLSEKHSLNLKGVLPFGALAAGAITLTLVGFIDLTHSYTVTIQSEDYLLDAGESSVIEVYHVRDEAQPSNHDAAMSVVVLEAGLEIETEGYTRIKAGEDVIYRVYQKVNLNAFSPANLADDIEIFHETSDTP